MEGRRRGDVLSVRGRLDKAGWVFYTGALGRKAGGVSGEEQEMTVMRSASGKLVEAPNSFPAVTQDFCLSHLPLNTSRTAASLVNLSEKQTQASARRLLFGVAHLATLNH